MSPLFSSPTKKYAFVAPCDTARTRAVPEVRRKRKNDQRTIVKAQVKVQVKKRYR
jgi:hypothetical protein